MEKIGGNLVEGIFFLGRSGSTGSCFILWDFRHTHGFAFPSLDLSEWSIL